MKIDLHVHTYPKSQCSKIDPKELVQEAKRIGLDGFCLTEHQFLWDPAEVSELAGDSGIKIFRGNEITTAQGDVLVFGLDVDIQGIITVEELHRYVREADAFSIAAHPFRGFKVFGFGQLDMSLDQACKKKILKYVDAVEVKNGRVTEQENEVAAKVSEKLNLMPTAGSDAHELDALGTWVMDFEDEIMEEKSLVRCLRSGKFTISSLR
ncbi:MAG: PHP-associated domain-containing protein [Desulfobacterales bacterium]